MVDALDSKSSSSRSVGSSPTGGTRRLLRIPLAGRHLRGYRRVHGRQDPQARRWRGPDRHRQSRPRACRGVHRQARPASCRSHPDQRYRPHHGPSVRAPRRRGILPARYCGAGCRGGTGADARMVRKARNSLAPVGGDVHPDLPHPCRFRDRIDRASCNRLDRTDPGADRQGEVGPGAAARPLQVIRQVR